jgi:type IV secretion system protein VirB9
MKKSKLQFAIKVLFNIIFIVLVALPCNAQTPITTDSRIRTLVYNPNEVYELKFYYNYQSFIEFSEDEEIEMISVGEAFAWRLTPAGKRLFIRPLEIAAHTNMTIITNRRIYHFDIRSDEFTGKADEDLVYTVRFFYPQIGQPLPMPPQLAVPNVAARPRKEKTSANPQSSGDLTGVIHTPIPKARVDEKLPGMVDRNPENSNLNFDYRFSGESDNIMPLKVYDDGNETHFQFANDNLVIPTISVVDINGNETPVSYTIRDRYVVIPIVSQQFTLRLSESILCIYNSRSLAI